MHKIAGWESSAYHLGFWPASLFLSVAVLLLRRRSINGKAVTALCAFFAAMVFFLFIGMVLQFKDPAVGQYDIFNSLVGLLYSVVMNHLILSLRLRDYETRMKYKRQSTYDSLSGLYNKQSSTEASRQYFQLHNPETSCIMLVLDLDNFKHINDTYGHYVGDRVLYSMGVTLAGAFRSEANG